MNIRERATLFAEFSTLRNVHTSAQGQRSRLDTQGVCTACSRICACLVVHKENVLSPGPVAVFITQCAVLHCGQPAG